MKLEETYRQIIVSKYNAIFEKWYVKFSNIQKAEIVLEINGIGHSGYSHNENKIIFRIPDGNLEDFNKVNYSRYPLLWETELLHEMLHEYQFKVLSKASSDGIRLFNTYQIDESTPKLSNGVSGFSGKGHNELFYSAIFKFYKEYTKDVEEFIRHYI